MNPGNADRWLVTSAIVVGGTYALSKWKGKTQTTVGTFATAWGTVFLILALVTEASPQFGGAFSLLVMTGDLLANAPTLASLVQSGESNSSSATSTTTKTTPAASVNSTAAAATGVTP
jgi:hypothetical protein